MEKTKESVAEALGRAHVALLADMKALGQAVRPSENDLAKLRSRLGSTRTNITEHFRFEEQNGYLDVVRKREPRLEREIHQLAEEHGQLSKSLDALIGKARTATSLGDSLRDETRQWIEQVRKHEVHENDVVQDAFDLDIGAED